MQDAWQRGELIRRMRDAMPEWQCAIKVLALIPDLASRQCVPVKLACNPGKHDQSTGSGKNDGGKPIDAQGGGNSTGVPA
jgi:hypothetical protein